MSDPRYPIGDLALDGPLSAAQRAEAIGQIAALPNQLHEAVRGLDDAQLDTPYRKGGWTVRQVVHHLADSHINAYIRHKLTISENMPTIQGYNEGVWAKMPDANGPIGASLMILTSLHERWAHCLRGQPAKVFARRANHSENGVVSLDELVATYGWHGRHHTAHITTLRRQKGW